MFKKIFNLFFILKEENTTENKHKKTNELIEKSRLISVKIQKKVEESFIGNYK